MVCLHVNYDELGDEGLSILLEPFAVSRQALEELSLIQNDIGKEGAAALVRATLPSLKKLYLEDNDEMPSRYIKEKYGDIVDFGADEEDDEEQDEDEEIGSLIRQFNAARL